MKAFLSILTMAALSVTLVTCATNPVTKKREFMVISEAEEIRMGTQQYGPYIQSLNGEYRNKDIQAYVREVGHKLAKVSHRSSMPYEFTVVNTSVVNAFAIPGGKIVVTRGLLQRFSNEAQLAAVLGHEIGHITAKHTANQMAKQWIMRNVYVYGDMLLNLKSPRYREHRRLYTTAGMLGIKYAGLAYSRSQEAQADDVGLEYMIKAGYDPHGMVELQEIFTSLRKSNPTFIDELQTTHPLGHKRIASAKKAIKTKYAPLIKSRKLGVYQERFQTRMAYLFKGGPAYAHYDKATELAGQGLWSQAISAYEKASTLIPTEGLFHADLGRAYMMMGNNKLAFQHFYQSIMEYPRFFKPRYYLGHIQYVHGQYRNSISNLLTAKHLLPRSANVMYMLANGYEKIGNREQAVLNYMEVRKLNLGGDLSQMALQRLQLMGASP